MPIDEVVRFLEFMDANGIDIVVDGGWGVDALLGKQSRPHLDLDIAVEHRFVEPLRLLLQSRGYRDIPRNDSHTYNFVMGDSNGHLIDIHSYEFDKNCQLLCGIAYPFDSLLGSGTIADRVVRCITPERMVEFHDAYQGDADDRQDVLALCQKFDIAVPQQYVAGEHGG
jgi:lincosamide nucleotidyltransferase A/C/D/E